MSSIRRRFDGVQLRRNRSGLGVQVVFSTPSSPEQTRGEVDADVDTPVPTASDHSRRESPGVRRLARRRLRRRAHVTSIVLTVVGSERRPVAVANGEARIGTDPDSDVVLEGSGLLPLHARVTLDEDGAMLRLPRSDLDVRLNHRRVESLAFLHDRDVIDIGDTTIAVHIDAGRDESAGQHGQSDRATRVRRVPPKFVLRGVTGPHFGKLIPIYGRLVIGRGNDCDLVLDEPGLSRRHAVIETMPDGLFLRDLGSANGSYLNGTRIRDSKLRHGDQIVLDNVRFLVQAIDQLDVPSTSMPPGRARKRWRVVVWVLAAAAVFTAGAITAWLLTR